MQSEGPFPTATATYLSQIYPLHNDQPYLLKNNLNIILAPTPKFYIWFLTVRLLYQNSLCITDHLPHMCHMSCQSLPIGFDHLIFSEQCRSWGSYWSKYQSWNHYYGIIDH